MGCAASPRMPAQFKPADPAPLTARWGDRRAISEAGFRVCCRGSISIAPRPCFRAVPSTREDDAQSSTSSSPGTIRKGRKPFSVVDHRRVSPKWKRVIVRQRAEDVGVPRELTTMARWTQRGLRGSRLGKDRGPCDHTRVGRRGKPNRAVARSDATASTRSYTTTLRT